MIAKALLVGVGWFQLIGQLTILVSGISSRSLSDGNSLWFLAILSVLATLITVASRKVEAVLWVLAQLIWGVFLLQAALLGLSIFGGISQPALSVITYLTLSSILVIFALRSDRKKHRQTALAREWLVAGLVTFWSWMIVVRMVLAWCQDNLRLDFDSQNFFVWVYTSLSGLLPYKDIFYWYGLFTYFKDANPIIYLLSLAWIFGLLVLWYWLLRAVLKDTVLAIQGWLLLVTVTNTMSGFSAFFRYGSSVVLIGWASVLTIRSPRRGSFIGGLVISLLVSLFLDQGLYAGLVYFLVMIMYWRQNGWRKTTQLWPVFPGFLLGGIPFAFWLTVNGVWADFIAAVGALGQVSMFAKVPFWHNVLTISNLAVMAMLWVTALDLSWLWWRGRRLSEPDALKLAWFGLLLIFQYKNITRGSIEQQYLFFLPGFILLYLQPWLQRLTFGRRWLRAAAYASLFFIFLLGILVMRSDARPLSVLETFTAQMKNPQELVFFGKNLPTRLSSCLDSSLHGLPGKITPEYRSVLNWVGDQGGGKMFAFPSDPIFYALFKQSPPPFFNGYDATSIFAQMADIGFIESQPVNFVILNLFQHPQQDGVPNEVRNKVMYSYLFRHFCPVYRTGLFAILQRNELVEGGCALEDFFGDKSVLPIEYRRYLSNTQLGAIPSLQGQSFAPADDGGFARFPDIVPLNKEIGSGQSLVIKYEPEGALSPQMALQFNLAEGQAIANFNACLPGHYCEVDLSYLPAFYFSRKAVSFQLLSAGAGSIRWWLVDTIDKNLQGRNSGDL